MSVQSRRFKNECGSFNVIQQQKEEFKRRKKTQTHDFGSNEPKKKKRSLTQKTRSLQTTSETIINGYGYSNRFIRLSLSVFLIHAYFHCRQFRSMP